MLKAVFSNGRLLASGVLLGAVAASVTSTAVLDGCSSDGGAGNCTPPIVVQPSFQGFHSWTSFSFECVQTHDSPHPTGPCTVYINQLPDAGATSFDVGTIIVKEFHNGATELGDTILAMQKVGCDYNSAGAVNWEFAQLQNNTNGVETLMWSGVVNPSTESYLDTGITCNQCHVGAVANDYVQSPPLQLPIQPWDAASQGDLGGDDAGAGSPDASGIVDAGGD